LDRQGRAATVLSLSLVCLLLAAADTGGVSAIRASRWMAKDADPVRVLGTVEAECLRPVVGDKAYLVEVGRAAFRTPLLLGGQAARAGITCETCHQGGRRNADFQFPGLSGAPGTADVTTALFSSHRDDGIDNPKPIPDLGGPKARLKVSQDAATPQLETFIHGQITEEFNGAEPPATVLKGLATYVRSMSPQACPAQERTALGPAHYASDATRAVEAAIGALDRHDPDTAILMLASARSRLGLIYERYDQPDATRSRAYLTTADADLAAALERIRSGDAGVRERLTVWLVRARDGRVILEADEPGSLFNPRRLR
jgi:hypothetical protein